MIKIYVSTIILSYVGIRYVDVFWVYGDTKTAEACQVWDPIFKTNYRILILQVDSER
jgi:hypothetical protein